MVWLIWVYAKFPWLIYDVWRDYQILTFNVCLCQLFLWQIMTWEAFKVIPICSGFLHGWGSTVHLDKQPALVKFTAVYMLKSNLGLYFSQPDLQRSYQQISSVRPWRFAMFHWCTSSYWAKKHHEYFEGMGGDLARIDRECNLLRKKPTLGFWPLQADEWAKQKGLYFLGWNSFRISSITLFSCAATTLHSVFEVDGHCFLIMPTAPY